MYTTDVCKMYTTFQQTFKRTIPAKFCIQNVYIYTKVCQNMEYILSAKVCQNVGNILYANILHTFCILFVYKMYTKVC